MGSKPQQCKQTLTLWSSGLLYPWVSREKKKKQNNLAVFLENTYYKESIKEKYYKVKRKSWIDIKLISTWRSHPHESWKNKGNILGLLKSRILQEEPDKVENSNPWIGVGALLVLWPQEAKRKASESWNSDIWKAQTLVFEGTKWN